MYRFVLLYGMAKMKKPLHKQKQHFYRFPGCPVGLSSTRRKRLVIEMLFKMQDGKCFYCQGKTWLRRPNQMKIKGFCATIDHIIPVCKGGFSDLENVVLACSDCNQRRGGRWINPVTKQRLSLPLNFGRRWDFLKDEQDAGTKVGHSEAEVLGCW